MTVAQHPIADKQADRDNQTCAALTAPYNNRGRIHDDT
jgi:hypothetical protein